MFHFLHGSMYLHLEEFAYATSCEGSPICECPKMF